MRIETSIKFHNRFDIEVLDSKTGDVKQRGVAENIILDQMYDRLCSMPNTDNVYFVNIHFGTGSGIPTPERNSLFTHLGTKAAVTEETIRAMPTSKWTRKVTLMPEEYVGETLTEVGIAYSGTTTHLLTHALIKDAEGNPLSISKTDLDVVVIYATVFVSFAEVLPEGLSWETGNIIGDHHSPVLNYLTGTRLYMDSLILFSNTSRAVIDRSLSFVSDAQNRSITASIRIPIDDANNEIINYVAVGGNTPVRPLLYKMPRTAVTNEVIGVGTGEESTYNTKFGFMIPGTLKLYVDGVETTAFSAEYNRPPAGYHSRKLWEITKFEGTQSTLDPWLLLGESGNLFRIMNTAPYAYVTLSVTQEDTINGIESLTTYVRRYKRLTIFTRSTGEEEFVQRASWYSSTSSMDRTLNLSNVENIEEIMLYITSGLNNQNDYIGPIFAQTNATYPDLITLTAPEDAVITADYEVDGLPKDENYVIDFDFLFQFGEGV